jgi:hypothetical protein
MVFGEAEFAELKTETFQFPKCFYTGVNMTLFSEVSISIMCRKHHRYPVVSCVMRQLFIASATYIFHNFEFSCRIFIGQTLSGLPRATKKDIGWLTKNRGDFSSAGLSLTFQTTQYSQSQL